MRLFKSECKDMTISLFGNYLLKKNNTYFDAPFCWLKYLFGKLSAKVHLTHNFGCKNKYKCNKTDILPN
jgi:hypothetical protein